MRRKDGGDHFHGDTSILRAAKGRTIQIDSSNQIACGQEMIRHLILEIDERLRISDSRTGNRNPGARLAGGLKRISRDEMRERFDM